MSTNWRQGTVIILDNLCFSSNVPLLVLHRFFQLRRFIIKVRSNEPTRFPAVLSFCSLRHILHKKAGVKMYNGYIEQTTSRNCDFEPGATELTVVTSTGIKFLLEQIEALEPVRKKMDAEIVKTKNSYSTTMSPGNQGVFQLLKKVTFRSAFLSGVSETAILS